MTREHTIRTLITCVRFGLTSFLIGLIVLLGQAVELIDRTEQAAGWMCRHTGHPHSMMLGWVCPCDCHHQDPRTLCEQGKHDACNGCACSCHVPPWRLLLADAERQAQDGDFQEAERLYRLLPTGTRLPEVLGSYDPELRGQPLLDRLLHDRPPFVGWLEQLTPSELASYYMLTASVLGHPDAGLIPELAARLRPGLAAEALVSWEAGGAMPPIVGPGLLSYLTACRNRAIHAQSPPVDAALRPAAERIAHPMALLWLSYGVDHDVAWRLIHDAHRLAPDSALITRRAIQLGLPVDPIPDSSADRYAARKQQEAP